MALIIHPEFGCELCGIESCGNLKTLQQHLAGNRHKKNLKIAEKSGKVPKRPRNQSEEEKAEALRAHQDAKRQRQAEQRVKRELEERRRKEDLARREKEEAEAWEAKGEALLDPEVRRPPAFEPVRGLWHPGKPTGAESEALEGKWRIYAEMAWMNYLGQTPTPDVMLSAAPVVPCEGTIELRRSAGGKGEEDGAAVDWGTPQPALVKGTWQLEHPEGHDKNHGMWPFPERLTTVPPEPVMICAGICVPESAEEKRDEPKERGDGDGSDGSDQQDSDDRGWMPFVGHSFPGRLVVPKGWKENCNAGEDVELDAQFHAGPDLKLRRLRPRPKELADLSKEKPFHAKEAIEFSRAIWERRDDVIDADAEPLVVRKGDLRIMVTFEEDEYIGEQNGNIYLCRREGAPAPDVEPSMEKPPRDEQRFMGLFYEE